MNTKSLTYYGLSLVALIIALVFFLKSIHIEALFVLIFGVAAVLLFRLGVAESKKQKPQ
jgi:membrane protein implicated in regulation of membrane protease activity